ncbi:MAG: hypothetical protein RIC82_10005, partial [Parvibaculum sp.]
MSRGERVQLFERGAFYIEPVLFALQPISQGADRRRVAERACMPDQGGGVDARDQVKRIEKLLCAAGKIIPIKKVGDRPLDCRYANVEPHAIDDRNAVHQASVFRGDATRRFHEPAREIRSLDDARLAGCDDLHLVAFRISTAVKLEGRVIGDNAAAPQAGCRQETIDRPLGGIGMLWDGRENAPRDALDIAGPKMLG